MSTPPSIIILVPVTVDDTTTPGTLIVNGNRKANQTDVSVNSTIEWNLKLAEGQTGSFDPLSKTETSGFSWTCTPPPGENIFSGTTVRLNDPCEA